MGTTAGVYDQNCWHPHGPDVEHQCVSYVNLGPWHDPVGGPCRHTDPPGGNGPEP